MCKIYAYARVSTTLASAKQDCERQKYLLEHSGMEFDEIFEEHVSGGVKGDQRAEFNRMLEQLDEKDIVCFTETSRFGRNYIDCFEMLDLITQSQIWNFLARETSSRGIGLIAVSHSQPLLDRVCTRQVTLNK